MSEFFHQYFDFNIMGAHFSEILEGFLRNLLLFAFAVVLSLAFGLFLALLRQLPGRKFMPLRGLTIAYIDVFRAIPVLIVLFLISGGIPYLNFLPKDIRIPHWLGQPDPFWYAVVGLTMVYGAYMAEVYRAGIEAVPAGQREAARSLGMSHGQTMRHVVVPQAVTLIPAPMLNEMISLLKETTLASVIAYSESLLLGREVLAETFNSSAVMLSGLMFLVVVLPLARLVDYLIKRNQTKITRGSHIEVA
ncbi:MAG TPA: amino acid ABC transporter permease [Solirubrobacterales bacterium]|nr:amino acid ABC transporter permease [Solirubrobacterales bacterium]